ncbi:hypothetical protein GUJ93_ZPchr0006g45607 [Zizania palustris]|uniref:Uncharacterized protein n=1 Tax=Zizania palustris TaxID=103762 RepID=A0A8J5S7T3_ZIZPA|nr:hypothetical protein GUJ93_ZPchr0006g45607 [Zizania palustris]
MTASLSRCLARTGAWNYAAASLGQGRGTPPLHARSRASLPLLDLERRCRLCAVDSLPFPSLFILPSPLLSALSLVCFSLPCAVRQPAFFPMLFSFMHAIQPKAPDTRLPQDARLPADAILHLGDAL